MIGGPFLEEVEWIEAEFPIVAIGAHEVSFPVHPAIGDDCPLFQALVAQETAFPITSLSNRSKRQVRRCKEFTMKVTRTHDHPSMILDLDPRFAVLGRLDPDMNNWKPRMQRTVGFT